MVAADLTEANGYAEREAAESDDRASCTGRLSLGADKGYDAFAFVARSAGAQRDPPIAQSLNGRRSAIDGRTTLHAGYAVSQQKRKRIEEPFSWGKTIGAPARPMLRGGSVHICHT